MKKTIWKLDSGKRDRPSCTFTGVTKHSSEPGLLKVDLMYEIARMLVVAIAAPVYPFGQWTQAVPGTAYIKGGEGGFNVTTGFLGRAPESHVVEPELVQELVTQYLNMPADVRQRLRVPLARLNAALVEALEDRVQAFIDIGVAMEAFLCPDEAQEISYRLALRGALYLGGPEGERAERRRTLKSLYGARSKAVHTGTLGKLRPDVSAELLGKTKSDFVAMLRKAIRAGNLPAWADLELGAPE